MEPHETAADRVDSFLSAQEAGAYFYCVTSTQHAETGAAARPAPSLLHVRDASIALTVSERHLRQLIIEGKVASVRIGRCIRIPRSEIDRIAREGA